MTEWALRALAAGLLASAGVVVLAADLSKNYDCSNREGIWELGGAAGSILVGLAILALAWRRRRPWLFGASAAVLTFVPISILEFYMAVGKCTN